jgi:hypothetical protein
MLGQMFGNRADWAVSPDQLRDHVVHWFENMTMHRHLPCRVGRDIVTRARLRFSGSGQDVLQANRCDVIDLELNMAFACPLVA